MKHLFVFFLVVSASAQAAKYSVICGAGSSRDFASSPDMARAVKQASLAVNEGLDRLQKDSPLLEVSAPQISNQTVLQFDSFSKSDMVISNASVCVTVKSAQ